MDNNETEKYVIVEFIEETNEDGITPVAVISSKWLIGDEGDDNSKLCYWPAYLKTENERIKATIQHSLLKFDLCGRSKINVVYSTRDYQKAVNKLKKIEEGYSASQTEDENLKKDKKRKRRKKQMDDFDTDDISEDNRVPTPPAIPIKVANLKRLQNTRIQPTSATSSYIVSNSQPASTSSSNIISTSTSTSTCLQCEQNGVLVRKISDQITKLKEEIKDDLKFIISLSSREFEDTISNTEINQRKTKEELEELNQELNNYNVMASMCAVFKLIGGHNAVDTTHRILKKIINHNLALQYNWKGANNKYSFKTLENIVKLITYGVRKNPFSKNTTQKEVEDIIKIWLRNAGDREGGRTKRKKNNQD